MNRAHRIAAIGSIFGLTLGLGAWSGQAIDPNSLGLVKGGVFDTPSPRPPVYREPAPGQATLLPRAYPGAPPQIPHAIEAFLPITAKSNACLGCHDQPALRGKKVPGMATPMPVSHYLDVRTGSDQVESHVDGSRYLCLQCHTAQADVKPLVRNTFSGGR
jgi:cytochrome c-type protein NapB